MSHADPPPASGRMTPAEFHVMREFLGLSGAWLARYLRVSERTVRHWEAGKHPIPDGVRVAVEDLDADTRLFVSRAIDRVTGQPEPLAVTYRSESDYRSAYPTITLPASWHRAVIARVKQEVPNLTIVYSDRQDAPRTTTTEGTKTHD